MAGRVDLGMAGFLANHPWVIILSVGRGCHPWEIRGPVVAGMVLGWVVRMVITVDLVLQDMV
jgi:hypothetical protein